MGRLFLERLVSEPPCCVAREAHRTSPVLRKSPGIDITAARSSFQCQIKSPKAIKRKDAWQCDTLQLHWCISSQQFWRDLLMLATVRSIQQSLMSLSKCSKTEVCSIHPQNLHKREHQKSKAFIVIQDDKTDAWNEQFRLTARLPFCVLCEHLFALRKIRQMRTYFLGEWEFQQRYHSFKSSPGQKIFCFVLLLGATPETAVSNRLPDENWHLSLQTVPVPWPGMAWLVGEEAIQGKPSEKAARFTTRIRESHGDHVRAICLSHSALLWSVKWNSG